MANTWPHGIRRAMDQSEHEAWNAVNYPGTRQLCCRCDDPTERCEEDSMFVGDVGPLCRECFEVLESEANDASENATTGEAPPRG